MMAVKPEEIEIGDWASKNEKLLWEVTAVRKGYVWYITCAGFGRDRCVTIERFAKMAHHKIEGIINESD